MDVFKRLSGVTFRRVGAAFLVFYLLLMGVMVVYVGQSPSQTVFLDQLGAQPYEMDSGRTLHFPKKPEQEQDTPCFYNIQPFKRPVFQNILPNVYLVNAFYNTGVVGAGLRAEIKILALLEGDTPPKVPIYCLYRQQNTFTSVLASFSAFQSDNDGKFQVYVMTCPLAQETAREEMCKVYISLQPTISATNDYITMPLLPIEEKRYPFSFALCVPPLRGVVPQNKLIEFIELHNILGADHFVFYRYEGDATSNYSNPNIDEILAYYEKVGLATVHPWHLPVPAEEVWHYGWKLAMHHCLLTNTWNYKYLLFSDIDEFLIPRGELSHWSDMMYRIDNDKYSGYCFYSSFFPPEPGELFVTMTSLQRTQVVNSQHMKCMVRPERVVEMGNQDVIKWTHDVIPGTHDVIPGTQDAVSTMEVNETLALIHHYKNCDKTIQGNCRDMIRDDVVMKFLRNLHSNHKSVMKYIMNSKEDQS